MLERDETLLDFLTPRQAEIVRACWEHGTIDKAAAVLGVHRSRVAEVVKDAPERAAAKGHAPGHFDNGTAPVYAMGKLTVRRGRTGEIDRTRKSRLRLVCQKRHAIHYDT